MSQICRGGLGVKQFEIFPGDGRVRLEDAKSKLADTGTDRSGRGG